MNNQVEYKLIQLSRSSFRSRFHLNDKMKAYVQDKGMETMRSHAYDFINKRLKPAYPKNDGKQTPMRANSHPVFIAQHATGTCCRGCLSKWYAMSQGRELTASEVDDIVDVIMGWLEKECQ